VVQRFPFFIVIFGLLITCCQALLNEDSEFTATVDFESPFEGDEAVFRCPSESQDRSALEEPGSRWRKTNTLLGCGWIKLDASTGTVALLVEVTNATHKDAVEPMPNERYEKGTADGLCDFKITSVTQEDSGPWHCYLEVRKLLGYEGRDPVFEEDQYFSSEAVDLNVVGEILISIKLFKYHFGFLVCEIAHRSVHRPHEISCCDCEELIDGV
jgi:hypothetical protein